MEIKDKKFVVVGLGKSGAALSRFLHGRGGRVTVTDMNDAPAFKKEMEDLGVRLELGFHDRDTFAGADTVVLSPGVPHTIEPVLAAKKQGAEVIGEIELASRFIEEPVVAVTGTNGKTTTVTLLTSMLRESGCSVFTGGNIGTPLIEYVDGGEKADLLVVEVSSFQLDTAQSFKPDVALLLNIEDDHLDRYRDFSHYAESKASIFRNQDEGDYAVISGTDEDVRNAVRGIRSRPLFFCGKMDGEMGARISGRALSIETDRASGISFDLSNVKLLGGHNAENISAAALAALHCGGTREGIQEAMDRFGGLPHRIEFAGTRGTVPFYNDSKATNVDAVKRAVECFDENLVLIMGGRDKGGNFSLLSESIQKRVKHLVLLGEASDIIRRELGRLVPNETAETMDEAVALAHRRAGEGGTVLLSPGCASFDMFNSYGQRGDVFKSAVKKLEDC